MTPEEAWADLTDRLENARDGLAQLSHRPTATLFERNRLQHKREGVLLALSYVRDYGMTTHPAPTEDAGR